VIPARASVELADQVEKAGSRGFEVRGELGNLVAQAIELSGREIGIDHGGHQHVHRESPIEETLHRDFGPTCKACREAIAMLSPLFAWAGADAHPEPSETRQRGVHS
jgi:hypothetical protein